MSPIANTRSSAGIPTGRLAVWWVVASEIVIFGGLLASYVMQRLAHPEWATQTSVTNVWIGGFNTFVLLTSSLSAVLAHQAAEHGDGKKAANLLYATCGGAVTFICVKALQWAHENPQGQKPSSKHVWSFYLTAPGIHPLQLIPGASIIVIVGP